MYLHEDREQFENLINLCAEQMEIPAIAIEKDYYVTMILSLLSQKSTNVVFKGGTSLSKCHKVINRFSEDIDIAVDMSLSHGRKRKLKYTIKDVAEELGLSIPNFDEIHGKNNVNRYQIEYDSVIAGENGSFSNAIMLETSFTTVSFPTVIMPVSNYIWEAVKEAHPEFVSEYNLEPFEMKVQGIDRTLADKVFAICDYYLQDKIKKHSRHIYDIYKILPLVGMDDGFRNLIEEVREARKVLADICPSAQDGVDIPALLQEIVNKQVYKDDYNRISKALLAEDINYRTAITAVEQLQVSEMPSR